MLVDTAICDPWEVGEAVGWRLLHAELVRTELNEQGGLALLRLIEPITYREVTYHYLVAAPRTMGHQIEEISSGQSLACALTGVRRELADSERPLTSDVWRGGLAVIGDVTPIK